MFAEKPQGRDWFCALIPGFLPFSHSFSGTKQHIQQKENDKNKKKKWVWSSLPEREKEGTEREREKDKDKEKESKNKFQVCGKVEADTL